MRIEDSREQLLNTALIAAKEFSKTEASKVATSINDLILEISSEVIRQVQFYKFKLFKGEVARALISDFEINVTPDVYNINHRWVTPNARGYGVGKVMLETVEELVKVISQNSDTEPVCGLKVRHYPVMLWFLKRGYTVTDAYDYNLLSGIYANPEGYGIDQNGIIWSHNGRDYKKFDVNLFKHLGFPPVDNSSHLMLLEAVRSRHSQI